MVRLGGQQKRNVGPIIRIHETLSFLCMVGMLWMNLLAKRHGKLSEDPISPLKKSMRNWEAGLSPEKDRLLRGVDDRKTPAVYCRKLDVR